MILNDGDNQNKIAWESRMFCTMKATHHALQHEAFLFFIYRHHFCESYAKYWCLCV